MRMLKKIAYSLFGSPIVLEVGPTVNGEMLYVQVQPINTFTILALVIAAVLFIVFMWFYLYPILQNRDILQPRSQLLGDVDAERSSPTLNHHERNTLLKWMRRGSRGRFADGNGDASSEKGKKDKRPSFLNATSTFFARSSLIPHLAPVTPPPPVYTTRPSSPCSNYRFPSPLLPAHGSPTPLPQTLAVPRIFVPSSRVSSRPTPGPTPMATSVSQPVTSAKVATTEIGIRAAPTTMRLCVSLGPRFVSDNLHPLSAVLPAPSRALIDVRDPGSSAADIGRIRINSVDTVSRVLKDTPWAPSSNTEAKGPTPF